LRAFLIASGRCGPVVGPSCLQLLRGAADPSQSPPPSLGPERCVLGGASLINADFTYASVYERED